MPGICPGRGAEERGQAEAIASSIRSCLKLPTPMVAAIIGEGGSGGAIALATGNRVVMYEHAIYCVISPEGCASILWRSADHARDAAEAMRITSDWMHKLGVVDAVVNEPVGGAHRDPAAAIDALGDAFIVQLDAMAGMDSTAIISDRYDKYLRLGNNHLG